MRRWPSFLLGLVLAACGGLAAPAVPTATPLPPLTAPVTVVTRVHRPGVASAISRTYQSR